MDNIIKMFKSDYNFILQDLYTIAKLCDKETKEIDVRLCIDIDYKSNEPNWIIRYGLSDYDQRLSIYCGASSVNKDVKYNGMDKVLEDLINQVLDQVSEGE